MSFSEVGRNDIETPIVRNDSIAVSPAYIFRLLWLHVERHHHRAARRGDTVFSNMYLAYDHLSDTMKGCIDGLEAWHDMGEGKAFRSKSGDAATDAAVELQPGAEHPVVGVHPVTGRRYLYVNRGFT